jgi:hypothetical protein
MMQYAGEDMDGKVARQCGDGNQGTALEVTHGRLKQPYRGLVLPGYT